MGRPGVRLWGAGLIALLALTAGPFATADPEPPHDPDRPGREHLAGSTEHLVTLVTGDRVRVGAGAPGRESIAMVAGPDGTSATVEIRRTAGRTYVLPDAARPFVISGGLDLALFDVTGLIEQGYDDGGSDTVPLIVQHADAATRRSGFAGAATTDVLTSIGASAIDVGKDAAGEFWASLAGDSATARTPGRLGSSVTRIWLDQRVRASLDVSVPQIGAPEAWAAGYTGDGVTVAVLDTGIDSSHPDLAGKVVAERNFSIEESAADGDGHGTHVASTVAGTGAASDGGYRGVAPDADLISGKVLDDSGFGESSDVISGMEWAAEQGADIISMSLGGGPTDGQDPASLAVNEITERTGALFVIAAGNDGPVAESVSTPGTADQALTVGAVDDEDVLADFSARGPRPADGAIKPEITAPGVDIVAARATGTGDGDPADRYVSMSGTSMATPHVAGAAAILKQQHPDWTAPQLKAALMATATAADGVSVYDQGAGRADVAAATSAELVPSAGKLDLGYFPWPHDGDEPVSQQVGYTNESTTDVTVALEFTASGALDVPAGAVTVSPDELTVPAGGTASATVTLDIDGLELGRYEGTLTATGDSPERSARVAVGWFNEPETYDVTVRAVGRDGSPAATFVDVLELGGLVGPQFVPTDDNGELTLRLRAGTYSIGSMLSLPATDTTPPEWSLVVEPEIEIAADTTVVLDAGAAEPVHTGVRGLRGSSERTAVLGYDRVADGEPFGLQSMVDTVEEGIAFSATPTAPVTRGEFSFVAGARLEANPVRAEIRRSDVALPTEYFLFSERFDGTMRLPVVDVGTATEAELDGVDLDGAVALIRRDAELLPGEQASAAAGAGARAALIYDPARPGPRIGFLSPVADIPVIATSRVAAAELQRLLARGRAEVELTGVSFSPYVYDLLVPVEGRVPDRPRWTFGKGDFARLDVTFGAHAPTGGTSEARAGSTPSGITTGSWYLPGIDTPAERTDYVLANDVRWTSSVLPGNVDSGASTDLVELPRSYRRGHREEVRWFRPVLTQSLPDGPDASHRVERLGTSLVAAIGGFVDQPDREQFFGDGQEFEMRLHRDGELIGSAPDRLGFFEVPEGPATFRLELDGRVNEQPWWLFSRQVSSAWTFHSTGDDGETPERLPLILADYDIPAADRTSRVRTGRPVRIEVGLRHQFEAPSPGIEAVSLEISYDDGATWAPVRLTGRDDQYVATVTHPRGTAGGAVSLRIDAVDADGNRLQQTVTRAYGLK